MKLHKDGTLDGTPAEIAEYQRLMEQKQIFHVRIGPNIAHMLMDLYGNEHKYTDGH